MDAENPGFNVSEENASLSVAAQRYLALYGDQFLSYPLNSSELIPNTNNMLVDYRQNHYPYDLSTYSNITNMQQSEVGVREDTGQLVTDVAALRMVDDERGKDVEMEECAPVVQREVGTQGSSGTQYEEMARLTPGVHVFARMHSALREQNGQTQNIVNEYNHDNINVTNAYRNSLGEVLSIPHSVGSIINHELPWQNVIIPICNGSGTTTSAPHMPLPSVPSPDAAGAHFSTTSHFGLLMPRGHAPQNHSPSSERVPYAAPTSDALHIHTQPHGAPFRSVTVQSSVSCQPGSVPSRSVTAAPAISTVCTATPARIQVPHYYPPTTLTPGHVLDLDQYISPPIPAPTGGLPPPVTTNSEMPHWYASPYLSDQELSWSTQRAETIVDQYGRPWTFPDQRRVHFDEPVAHRTRAHSANPSAVTAVVSPPGSNRWLSRPRGLLRPQTC